MTWRNAFGLLSKKNRTYTVVGVITFVLLTYVVYNYVLPEKAKAWIYSWVASPKFETALHGQAKVVRGWKGGGTQSNPMTPDEDPIFSN